MDLLPFDRCSVVEVCASVHREGSSVEFTFLVSSPAGEIVIPQAAAPGRAATLWRGTCFHAFISTGKRSYIKLDFSPSGEWAAYRFGDYRTAMQPFEMPPVDISFEDSRLTARVELPSDLHQGAALGLAAALEHRSGARSYWALAHPKSNRPDFHARDCFIAQLP